MCELGRGLSVFPFPIPFHTLSLLELCVMSNCVTLIVNVWLSEILPSEPLNVETLALSSSSINVSWSVPLRNGDTVTEYVLNITTLRSFDPPFTGLGYGEELTSDSSSASSSSESGSDEGKKVSGSESPAVDHSNDSYIQAHAASMASRNRTSTTTTHSSSIDENAEDKVEAKMMQLKVTAERMGH